MYRVHEIKATAAQTASPFKTFRGGCVTRESGMLITRGLLRLLDVYIPDWDANHAIVHYERYNQNERGMA